MRYDVAVLGATGAVGEVMIKILETHQFPIRHLYPLASERSCGDKVTFQGQSLTVLNVAEFDFKQVQFAFFSAGAQASAIYAPKATKAGCIVIDNTSQFRADPNIPLIIPEVNLAALKDFSHKRIIANPNCSTIQMLVALKPLYDAVGISRINVATYQSVSGTGRNAIHELMQQTQDALRGEQIQQQVYPIQIAFNLIPHIDEFEANGYTREEMKMVNETKKILNDPDIVVNPTAVRVPVVYGHACALHIETKTKLTATEAKSLLAKAPGIQLKDAAKPQGYPSPVCSAAGQDAVFVGRVREDISHPLGLNLWVVADNIRKGAALNSIQIAQRLIEHYGKAI